MTQNICCTHRKDCPCTHHITINSPWEPCMATPLMSWLHHSYHCCSTGCTTGIDLLKYFCVLNVIVPSFGSKSTKYICIHTIVRFKIEINRNLFPSVSINTRKFHLFWFICIIPCAFPYMVQTICMKCTAQVSKWNFLYVPCPLLLTRPHLSLDSLQKVGLSARPARGAVEKNGQLVSPVTALLMKCIVPKYFALNVPVLLQVQLRLKAELNLFKNHVVPKIKLTLAIIQNICRKMVSWKWGGNRLS